HAARAMTPTAIEIGNGCHEPGKRALKTSSERLRVPYGHLYFGRDRIRCERIATSNGAIGDIFLRAARFLLLAAGAGHLTACADGAMSTAIIAPNTAERCKAGEVVARRWRLRVGDQAGQQFDLRRDGHQPRPRRSSRQHVAGPTVAPTTAASRAQ